jgi:CRP/FNR family transcriptional regulator
MKDLRAHIANLPESVKVRALQECRLFEGLTSTELNDLAVRAVSIRYTKGDFIFTEGDPAEFFFLAQEGLITLHKGLASGKNVIFIIASIGDTLNAAALSMNKHFLSAQAITDAVVLRIPRNEFWELVGRRPQIALSIIGLTATALNSEYNRIMDILGEDVELRVVHSLFTLATKFGPNLMLKREELANYAGTTTESAIRVLSKLKKREIISSAGRGAIFISDLARLQNYRR